MKNNNYHESVMVREVMDSLHIKKLAKYIDATLGSGGHSLEILKLGGQVLGIEVDPEMLRMAEERIENEIGKTDKFKAINSNFESIDEVAKKNGWEKVDGILFDLGVSNIHLKDEARGFSFGNGEADLDMRLDPGSQGVKASDLLNVLREDQLRSLFEVTLDPGAAKWITGRVIHAREEKPIKTVSDMLEICEGLKTGKHGISEATLPFLALRIAVNSELENLKKTLPKAFNLLADGGRLVVISFHSKEDAIVKDFFREKERNGEAKLINFKPIVPGTREIEANKRSRSAKMRVLQRN